MASSGKVLVVKEGFLNKKGGIIKCWNRRYFMLNKQSLVYFRREQGIDNDTSQTTLTSPLGRIFLSDVTSIETENVDKKKPFVFSLHTKKRVLLFQAFNSAELNSWVDAIHKTLKTEGEAEKKDPFRRTLRRLAPGLKRVTLMKDPKKGIGCTVKNAAGHIFVNRIIEDGPIALTGVLRPDDEILDVNGVVLTGMTMMEVRKAIQDCPEEFLATVRPITALKKIRSQDAARINYVTVLPALTPNMSGVVASNGGGAAEESHSDESLDDVGNYDDDEEDHDAAAKLPPCFDETPPPVPAWTDDAQILVQSHNREHKGELVRTRSRSLGDARSGAMQLPRKPVHQYEDVAPRLYIDVELELVKTAPK